jgi:hypothetical protein
MRNGNKGMKRKKDKKTKKKDFHRSYDVAGVTVIWNSPPPPLAAEDVPAVVVVREVDDVDGEGDKDVGMS